ncbi:MAG: hypothetical protein KC994_24250 [Candidatus Omnitrophica bacterium]|nr:hypothetical protein [Candidatus Omnitrophota bacterium]
MKPRHLLIPLLLFAIPLYAQWQEVANEQLPDNLEADTIQAQDSSGLALKNSSGELGLFIGADGNLGIQESNLASWSSAFSAIEFDQKSAFMSGSTAIHVLMNAYYDGSNWRYIAADEASGYYQANGGHYFRVTASTGSPGGVLTWNDAMQLDNDGDLIGNGDLDFDGAAEFGDSSNTLTVYQSASEAMLAQPVFQGMVHDYADDIIHPATVGYDEYATFPCPWSTPGTVLASVNFIVKMGTSFERCNFSVRAQSGSSPGTTTDLVSFAGSDFHQSNGLTSISGSYYQRSETLDHTVSTGEKFWAVVRLKAVNAETDAALHGIEWIFEKRAY